MDHLLLVHEAHKLPMDHSALIPPHIKCSCPLLAMRCCQPPPAMRHRRTNLVASTPSGFLLLDATSGFFLTTAAAKSRYAVAGSVVPQATTVFTDKLPPKPDLDPPPPDLHPTAAILLSEFLSLPPSPYARFQGKETP
jgi:hypothetical protein